MLVNAVYKCEDTLRQGATNWPWQSEALHVSEAIEAEITLSKNYRFGIELSLVQNGVGHLALSTP